MPRRRLVSVAAGALVGVLLALVAAQYAAAPSVGLPPELSDARAAAPAAPPPVPQDSLEPVVFERLPDPSALPSGKRALGRDTLLVAYYGTAGTGALGVLGEAPPGKIMRRLAQEARKYRAPGRPVQMVFELIVTVADAVPGPGRDFNHDIVRSRVRQYVEAAHRHGVLLVLDIQPGRSRFLSVVRRWEWALRDPWVGLALDPEWRVQAPYRPGGVIGHANAAEINRTTAWLARLIKRGRLPEKVVLLHQFRREMIPDVEEVRSHRGLVMVQHIDGFGTPRQKLATYHHVARPQQFRMGFKLFYDEDRPRLSARQVLSLRPRVSFVSYQ